MSSAKLIKDLLGIKILPIFMVNLRESELSSLFLDRFDDTIFIFLGQNVLNYFGS